MATLEDFIVFDDAVEVEQAMSMSAPLSAALSSPATTQQDFAESLFGFIQSDDEMLPVVEPAMLPEAMHPVQHYDFVSYQPAAFPQIKLPPLPKQPVDMTGFPFDQAMPYYPSQLPLPKDTHAKTLKCTHPGCNKMFAKAATLRSHFKNHSGRKSFPCTECQATFGRPHDLRRHIQSIHVSERAFACAVCRKRFARGDALKRHASRVNSQCYQPHFEL